MSPSHGWNNPTPKTKTGIWISLLQYPVLVKRWVNVGYGYHANEQPHARICFSKRCLYTHSLSYVWVYVSGTKILMRAQRAWCLKYFSHMDNDNGMLFVIDTHSSGGMFFLSFVGSTYMFYNSHCRVKIGDIFLGLISQHRIYRFIDIRVVVLHCTRGYRAMTAIVSGLTHWGWVTHICVGNLTIIGSDYGLSPGRRQAIIWTNAGILLIRTLGTNFGEILGEILSIFILENAFENVVCEMASILSRPQWVNSLWSLCTTHCNLAVNTGDYHTCITSNLNPRIDK